MVANAGLNPDLSVDKSNGLGTFSKSPIIPHKSLVTSANK